MAIGECVACGRNPLSVDRDRLCPMCRRLHSCEIQESDILMLARYALKFAKIRIKEITGKRPYGKY
jgi:hypothetical protein